MSPPSLTAATTSVATDLDEFYDAMTSLTRVLARLEHDGVDVTRLRAADLAERDLDCQNLGGHRMLARIANTVTAISAVAPSDAVLDVGCGIGGPGRFLVERFGCTVTGIDLLRSRVEVAEELTHRTGLASRLTYHVADLVSTPFDDASFEQAWMLDVGIHVRDKASMFAELARVLRPGGLLVMHDQTGPLGTTMRPITRRAPYIAPPLPRLIRHVEEAGLRLLEWQDTTAMILTYFEEMRAATPPVDPAAPPAARRRRQWRERVITSYLATLSGRDGRTGLLIAVRR
jgi:SAM-dependent methyltransferase